jgi:hypothetical protein
MRKTAAKTHRSNSAVTELSLQATVQSDSRGGHADRSGGGAPDYPS